MDMSAPNPKSSSRGIVRWSISGKLLAAAVLVGVVAAAIGILGLQRMDVLHQRLTKTVDYSSEKVKLGALLKQDLVSVTRAEKNLILARSDEEMTRYTNVIDEMLAAMDEHERQLRKLVDDEDRRQLDTFATNWAAWRENHENVRNFVQLNSDLRARQLSLGKARESFERMEGALAALADEVALDVSPAPVSPGESVPAPSAGKKYELVVGLLEAAAKIQRTEKQIVLSGSDEELERFARDAESLQSRIETGFAELLPLADEAEQSWIEQGRAAFQDYIKTLEEIRSFVGQRGNFFVRQFANTVGAPIAAECEQLLNEIVAKNERDLRDYRDESRAIYVTARNTLVAFSVVGILVSVAVTFLTGRQIARNIGRLADYSRQVQSTGDLSQPLPQVSRDEVGALAEAFDHMRQSLHRQATELAALNAALDQKNQEMEQFVYTVSHDLSSPIVSCKGLVGLMWEDLETANYAEVVESTKRLDHALDQLKLVIDDLLTLSRIGRKSLDLVTVDVDALVRELRDELDDRLVDIGARMEIEGPLPPVIADAKDVRRVLENLVVNAIKYGCDGLHPVITVGSRTVSNEVQLSVHDNGQGIDPEYQDQIFGLFQRLDTGKPGTGLGLASVARIMRLHGGRTWVDSKPGKGATFWVAFPIPRFAAGIPA
jgi:signal transduction histidine kinase